jgi:FtsH-binding integral membrane protein
MTNDVEKRWHDPGAFRAAVAYVSLVIVLTALVFAVYAFGDPDRIWLAAATPGVLFLGALGAFVKTYRDWRAMRTSPIWQGAGWFLLAMSLLAFGVPASAAMLQ